MDPLSGLAVENKSFCYWAIGEGDVWSFNIEERLCY
jgi:hypothetical protein